MKTDKIRSYARVILLSWLFNLTGHATTINWTNTTGGNWNGAANWNPNQVPGAADTAVITTAGTYTVTLNVGATVAGMVLGASSGVTTQTFSINGQTLTLNGQATVNANGAFNFISGYLAGAAVLAGTMNAEGVLVNPGASLTVANNGVLNVMTGGNGYFQLEGPLTNNGAVNWLGNLVNVVNDNGVNYKGAIWNQSGAQWNIECNEPVTDSQDSGLYEIFHNAGLLCKTNVSGTTTFGVYLNNTGGTVQGQIGTIQFNNGCNLAGTFQAASGAAIDFTAGNYAWNGTAVFEGPGSVAITGGTVTVTAPLSTPFTASGIILSNLGNLRGSAYLTNVNIADAETIMGTNIVWGGAQIEVTGSLTVANNGVLNVATGGNGYFQLEGPLTNNGVVNWLGNVVNVVNDNGINYKGAVWNRAGGQWYIECNQPMTDSQDGGVYEFFHNAGLLCKTNVSGTTTFGVYLDNTGGTVQAQIGTIQFNYGCNLAGTFQAASGAAVDFTAGNYAWNGTAVFEGPGSVAITGGTVTITALLASPFTASGVIVSNLSNLQGSAYLTNVNIADAETIRGTNIVWGGAQIEPSASLTVASNAVLNIAAGGNGYFQLEGPLTNYGTINWLGNVVNVVNDTGFTYKGAVWNQPSGQWYIECNQSVTDSQDGGVYEFFHNAGLLCKTNVSGTTTFGVYLDNTGGTVQAQIGTIQFNYGCNLAGTFQAASGAAIDFTAGNYDWNGTAVFEGPGSVAITGGTVAITTPLASPFTASGVIVSNLSNLQGSAYLTNVNIADAETIRGTNIVWGGAQIEPSGSLTVASNGVLNIVAGGNGYFQLEGPLTNYGTVNWLGNVVNVVNDNGVTYKGAIWNQAIGQWFIESDQSMTDSQDGGVYEFFNNAGLLCKTNVSGTTTIGVYVNNTGGLVQAQVGTIDLSYGCNLGGVFQAATGAAIQFTAGNYLWNGTAVFEGPGSVQIIGGTVTITTSLTTPFTAAGIIITNLSNLRGSAYLTNINIADGETVAGTNIVLGGVLVEPSGSLTVNAGGVLDIAAGGNGYFQLEGPLTNYGTVTWLANLVEVINDNGVTYKGAIWNQASGQWYIECDQTMSDSQDSGLYEIFHNAGFLCKTNVSGTTTFDVMLNNTIGTVDAEIGVMVFDNGYTLGGGGTLSFGLNSLTSYGQITLANTAPLNGALAAHLNNGYVPAPSNSFTLLSYGAFTGSFNNTNLPPVATWQTTYNPTTLTIKVLSSTPPPTRPALKIMASLANITLSWPTNASGFLLYRTANLAPPVAWTLVTNAIAINGTNDTVSLPASGKNGYFALIAP